MKTAYIELNTSNQIRTICQKKEKPFFTYKGIVFYPNANVTSLSEILHKDYQCFILDMGVLNTYTTREFLRCDKPDTLFKNMHYQHCKVIMNLCEKESHPSYLLDACEHIPFPFFPNPFQLEAKRFHAIYQILKM